ncbi:MAG TPA: DUF5615 family PIN-like protein [Streptosporangiaceae bacterium]|nr:DUF5615 family PIN-like protein [Streptosporangiaceae bacterium]
MFRAAAASLRGKYGHDAVHGTENGLRGAPDTQVAATARAEGRADVTENVTDFAGSSETPRPRRSRRCRRPGTGGPRGPPRRRA